MTFNKTKFKKFLSKYNIEINSEIKFDSEFYTTFGDNMMNDIISGNLKNRHGLSTSDFLNKIKNKYGSLISSFTYFCMLNDNLYTEPSYGPGGYEYLFEIEILSSNYKSVDGKHIYLETLINEGSRIVDFLDHIGLSHRASKLKKHFENVKIKVYDRDDIITLEDFPEKHEQLVDNLQEILDKQGQDEIHINNLEDIEFTCTCEGEIFNISETYEYTSELIDVFNSMDVIYRDHIIKQLNKKKVPKIELRVCSILEGQCYNQHYFSDMVGHPKEVLNEFIKSYERYKDSDSDIMIVETYSDHIVNYIRWLVVKENVELVDDIFSYWDNEGKLYEMSINNKGDFIPEFPSGFYDITLKNIYDLKKKD